MGVCRCLCSYNRKVDPPLFSILHLVLHFFLFQNSSLPCPCPSLPLPRFPGNSPVLLSAHCFKLYCIHTQTWCLCYIGSFISQPYLTQCHLDGLTSLHTPKLPYNYVVCVGYPTPKTKIPNAKSLRFSLDSSPCVQLSSFLGAVCIPVQEINFFHSF